jgi:hypothetical protein
VAKLIPSVNVTYTESGSIALTGTQLTLTATCACTNLGSPPSPQDCSANLPVTTWAYTVAAGGFDAIHADKATGLTIVETFAKQ